MYIHVIYRDWGERKVEGILQVGLSPAEKEDLAGLTLEQLEELIMDEV